jgi:RNA polymerase sigma-70 factor (ECF subfamily)
LRLQDAVRALPLARRQVVTLALEGFSHAEIAQALGISEGNVAVRLNRARSALSAVLGGVS